MTTAEIRRAYDRIAPRFDLMEVPLEWLVFRSLRRRWLARAKGRVLEVAAGTGKSSPFYPSDCRVVYLDLSEGMLARALRRVPGKGGAHGFVVSDTMSLPFADSTFDTVVCALSLCTVPAPVQALAEMARVCRSSGRILLIEHVRSSNAAIARLQDRLTPRQARRIGCHLNRDTLSSVLAAGLDATTVIHRFAGIILLVETRAG